MPEVPLWCVEWQNETTGKPVFTVFDVYAKAVAFGDEVRALGRPPIGPWKL